MTDPKPSDCYTAEEIRQGVKGGFWHPAKKLTAEERAQEVYKAYLVNPALKGIVQCIAEALTLAAQEARAEAIQESLKVRSCPDCYDSGVEDGKREAGEWIQRTAKENFEEGAEAMREQAANRAALFEELVNALRYELMYMEDDPHKAKVLDLLRRCEGRS